MSYAAIAFLIGLVACLIWLIRWSKANHPVFHEMDIVVLTVPYLDLPVGSRGTIVYLSIDGLSAEVEFYEGEKMIALETVLLTDIKLDLP